VSEQIQEFLSCCRGVHIAHHDIHKAIEAATVPPIFTEEDAAALVEGVAHLMVVTKHISQMLARLFQGGARIPAEWQTAIALAERAGRICPCDACKAAAPSEPSRIVVVG